MKVLVLGSINLDRVLAVEHPPEAGETVLGRGTLMSPGGKGANQAHAARSYGADVHLVGRVGDDALASPALTLLQDAGVNLSGVIRDATRGTGFALVMVLPNGDNAIVVDVGANDALRAEDVSESVVAGASWLLLQMETPVEVSMAVARRVKARNGRVLLNLAPAHDIERVEPSLIDWLVLNRGELSALCRAVGLPDSDAAVGAVAISSAWGCTTVVTLGAEGALAVGPGLPLRHVPAPTTDVIDTTGAGDTFCGVLTAALAQGVVADEALRTACAAASLACRKPGAQGSQPSRAEIDAALA
jgi:ribokinase